MVFPIPISPKAISTVVKLYDITGISKPAKVKAKLIWTVFFRPIRHIKWPVGIDNTKKPEKNMKKRLNSPGNL